MTRVEVQYELTLPFEDRLLPSIGSLNSVYGIESVRLGDSLVSLTVAYDASRLSPADLDRVLSSAGLPVRNSGINGDRRP